jgi:hypothetical protein
MSKLTILITGMLFGVMCLVGPASAATGFIRCGTHTISDSGRQGPGKYEIIKKCGQPSDRFGNTWVYDRPGKATTILRFNDSGQLMSISD